LDNRSTPQVDLEQWVGGMAWQKLTGLPLPIHTSTDQRTFSNARITENDEVVVVLNGDTNTDWEWLKKLSPDRPQSLGGRLILAALRWLLSLATPPKDQIDQADAGYNEQQEEEHQHDKEPRARQPRSLASCAS
jgi:hypothetical protein